MVSILYPGMPQGPDISGFTDGLAGLGQMLDNRRANKAYAQYDEWLRGISEPQQAQQQPMSLASLGQQGGQVERAPLPPVQDAASARVSQAHGDMGGDIFSRFMKTVQAGGVTNPAALAAIAATGKHESGFSERNASGTWSDPSQSGQAGTSGGIMSWRNERLNNLQRFAQANGDNPNAPSPETQAKFLLQEDPSLIQKLQQVRSPQEAQQLMNNAWRFAGYDQQGGEAGARMQTAQAFAGQFGGQGQGQEALQAFAAPSGQQMPQSAPQGNAGSLLPPADVMKALFKSEQTRPLAIQLAQSAQKARMGDPEAALKLEKMRLEVENLRNPKQNLPAGVQEYEYARAQGFPGTFQDWEASKKGGMSLSVDPTTGAVTFQQGQNIKPLTEGQSKDTVYATRATGALPLIDKYGDALTSLGESVGGQAPVVGNYMKSPEYQQAEQAGNEFLQAILRKDTGAAITKSEMDEYGSVYLPRPGDSKQLLEQKKVSRQRALEAIKAGMPAQAILQMEKAGANVWSGAADTPQPGAVVDGYRFKGGDPSDQSSWEPAN